MNAQALVDAWQSLRREIGALGAITSSDDLQHTMRAIDQLVDITGADPEHPLSGLLELLAQLVEAFEARQFDSASTTPVDVLRLLMASNGLRQRDLAAEFGGQPVVSAVLRGRRKITARQAGALAARFGVSAALFIDRQERAPASSPEPRRSHSVGQGAVSPAAMTADRSAVWCRLRHPLRREDQLTAAGEPAAQTVEDIRIPSTAYQPPGQSANRPPRPWRLDLANATRITHVH